jgi:acyl dehydratase
MNPTEPPDPQVHEPLISPEAVADLRSRIGETMTVGGDPYLTEATPDAARHWADALGDRNPLWRDADYARSFGYDSTLAPPTMLYAFSKLSIGYRGGLPGVHSFFGGTNWSWDQPIARGTSIDVEVIFKDLIEHKSSFAEVSFQQISDISYRDQHGRVIATAEAWGMRTSRRKAKERDSYGMVEPATYSRSEIAAIGERYASEEIMREPRSGVSLAVGTEIPEIIRGPYTVTTAIAFEQAWGGLFIRAHGDWYEFIAEHPAAAIYNELGIPEPPEAVHWDGGFARKAGVPQPYDYGPERLSWIGVALTNWMGPLGLLRRLDVQVRKFNLVGDLTTCRGVVTSVADHADGWLVGLDVSAANQRAEKTAFGTAEVILRRA